MTGRLTVPGVTEIGEIRDLDGLPMQVAADHDAVVIRIGGVSVMLDDAGREALDRLLDTADDLAAKWRAENPGGE